MSEQGDFCFQWLRGYYILGDDLKNNSIFSKILAAEEKGQETFPLNSGLNKYDFISVDNLAREIALSVIQDKITGVINCCTGNPVSLKEKVEEFIKVNHLNIKPKYGVFPERSYDSPIIYGNTEKIVEIIRLAEGNEQVRKAADILKEIVAQ